MNPLRITATNYRSFESLDLELPAGCLAVIGENGAGKSSIVNVIDLALFGARNLGDYLSEDVFDEAMTLALEFEHGGQVYRVRRTYSPRGRGSAKLDFEIYDARESWEPLTRENAGATQELIEQTLGLSRETFRASAFLAQGDGAAFTEAQPRERKAILAEVLQLDVWDRLLDRARCDRREVETALERLTGKIELAGHELEQRPLVISERDSHAMAQGLARTDLEQAKLAAADVDNRLVDAKQREAARASAAELVKAKAAALANVSDRLHELADEDADIREVLLQRPALVDQATKVELLEHELVLAQRAQGDRRDHERLVVERNRLLGEANDLNEKAAKLRTLAEEIATTDDKSCDRCGQTLGAEARDRAVRSYRQEADDFDERAHELDDAAQAVPVSAAADRAAASVGARELSAVEIELHGARKAREQLAAMAERDKRLGAIAGEVAKLQGARPTLERERDEAAAELDRLSDGPRVELLERESQAAKHRVAGADQKLSSLDQALARCDERLERLAKLEADLAETREQVAAKQNEIDLLALAEKAYGRDGIPALIVENAAIPQIELEASRILGELGTPFRVELRTQRALKSGEGVRDTLDIVICSPAGERPYETFSGGERTRLNLALRIALARLLAHRRGAESRLLAIDEPEFLDEAGVQQLAEVLQGLSDDFDRIVLISHVPTLATAFDQTLVVQKLADGRSVVGEQAVFESNQAEAKAAA